MSNLNFNISLPQELVINLLIEAEQEKIDLSLHIANKLRLESYDTSFLDCHETELALLSQAMYCAAHLKEGDTFTLKELFKRFEAEWEDVKSPRSFGRKFKKEILKLEIAEIAGKKADNKIIYKRTSITNEDVQSGKYFINTNLLADGMLKQ